jgi:hypothetical protein
MLRTLATLALAAALALPAAPARPQQLDAEQAARILGALLTFQGRADALEDDDRRRLERRRYGHADRWHADRLHADRLHADRWHADRWRDAGPAYRYPRDRFEREWEADRRDRHRDAIRRDDRFPDRVPRLDRPRVVLYAPDRCRLTFSRGHGPQAGYDARCMRLAVDRPGLLPDGCLLRARTMRGARTVYAGRCLDRAGWTTKP